VRSLTRPNWSQRLRMASLNMLWVIPFLVWTIWPWKSSKIMTFWCKPFFPIPICQGPTMKRFLEGNWYHTINEVWSGGAAWSAQPDHGEGTINHIDLWWMDHLILHRYMHSIFRLIDTVVDWLTDCLIGLIWLIGLILLIWPDLIDLIWLMWLIRFHWLI